MSGKIISNEAYKRALLPKNLKGYSHINGQLLDEEIYKAGFNYASFGREILCTGSMVRESTLRNYIRTKYMPLICKILDKPEGFFDYKEEPKEVTEPVKKDEDDAFNACLLIELKKIEGLLISINRRLDGKPTSFVINKKED